MELKEFIQKWNVRAKELALLNSKELFNINESDVDFLESLVKSIQLNKEMKKCNENICKKCGHDKRGLFHKVYSSCARYKKGIDKYRQSNLLNNYLNKLPYEFNEKYTAEVYQDDINFCELTGNEFILGIIKNIEKRSKNG